MGDPKKPKKKYSTPMHPWNKTDIEASRALKREFGLNKRREILVAESFLKKYKNIAKRLIASSTEQGEKEKQQILTKLQGLGLLPAGAELDQILGLKVEDVLNRRLQSVVCRNGLARTMKQARQFIVHRHVKVGDKEITAPSYLTTLAEESSVSFKDKSALSDEEHPERALPEQNTPAKTASEDKKEEVVAEEKSEKKEESAKQVEKAEEKKETENKDENKAADNAEEKSE